MSARPEAPPARTLSVLLIEDSAADAQLAVGRLRSAGYDCRHQCVVNEVELRAALAEETPDLILSDFSLPGFDGMTALAIARELAPSVPFIFLSGTIGEERAIEALRRGATDYVLKGNPKRLVPAVVRALEEAALRKSSRLAEQRVARLTGVLQMLSGINAALVRIQGRDQVMAEACRLAVRFGGYNLAMVALINPDTRMARPVGWAGYEFMPAVGSEIPVAENEAGDTSLMGRVIRTGEAMLCEDIRQFPFAIHRREELIAEGVRALACLPLKVDDTSVGSFLLGAKQSSVIGPDELLLLEEVAGNLSFAIQYLTRQDELNFLSYFEPLTGLAKRALFCERLNRLLTQGADNLPRIAVTVFDLAHLSVVNDSFGRHTGDRLLQCVADRLKSRFPDTEQLTHLGGGTFACFNALPERAATDLHDLHADITRLFTRPFSVDSHELATEIKSGYACFPDDGRDANLLVQNAEAALKEAKASGEQYLHHRLERNSELARRVGLEHRLRSALEEHQFVLHYQPKIVLRTQQVVGVEALLRWNDPENGLVPPAAFLPLLESSGLLAATGSWVLWQAAHDCREWRRRGLPPLRIAVNIAPEQLRRRHIAREILDAIGDLAGQPDSGIDIEITEGALSGDSSSCVHALRLLKAAGVGVAIDDFGTGFSSLGRLAELPVDTLKIDRSFTNRLPTDRKCCTLVSTIIALARAFDMTTVAEGVENQSQLDHLVREGCDQAQGYFHAKPMARADLEQWLAKFNQASASRAGGTRH